MLGSYVHCTQKFQNFISLFLSLLFSCLSLFFFFLSSSFFLSGLCSPKSGWTRLLLYLNPTNVSSTLSSSSSSSSPSSSSSSSSSKYHKDLRAGGSSFIIPKRGLGQLGQISYGNVLDIGSPRPLQYIR